MRGESVSPPPQSNSSASNRHSRSSNTSSYQHRSQINQYQQSHQYYSSSGMSRQSYRNEFANDLDENYEEDRSKKDLRARLDQLKKSKERASSSDDRDIKSTIHQELELRASLQSAYYRQNPDMTANASLKTEYRSSSTHFNRHHSKQSSNERDDTKRTSRHSTHESSSRSSNYHKHEDKLSPNDKKPKLSSTISSSSSSRSRIKEKSKLSSMMNDAEVNEIVSEEEQSDGHEDHLVEDKKIKRKSNERKTQKKTESDDDGSIEKENSSRSSQNEENISIEKENSINSEESIKKIQKEEKIETNSAASQSTSQSGSRTRSNSISENETDNEQNVTNSNSTRTSSIHSDKKNLSDTAESNNSHTSEEDEEHHETSKKKSSGKKHPHSKNHYEKKSKRKRKNSNNETLSEQSNSENEEDEVKNKKNKNHHKKSRNHKRSESNSSASSVHSKKEMDIDKEELSEKDSSAKLDESVEPVEPETITYYCAIQGCRSVEEFECLNKIEEGAYGVVYRAKDKKTHEVVALKRLKMEKEKEGFPITSIREVDTLLKAQHPNVVTVREIVVGSNMDKIYMCMEYVEHDLKSLMQYGMKKPFLMSEVKTLMQQLLNGMSHLHDNWIIHRDLKTSNLLLSHKGLLKIADFGLAREYGSPLKEYTPIVVTLWYRCPELLLGTHKYSTAIDMWSVGCIFGELMLMKALFPGKNEKDQLDKIFKDLGTPNDKIWPGFKDLPLTKKLNFPEFPYNTLRSRFGNYLTDKGFELINKLLTYDPVRRISADEALKHELFKESPLPLDASIFPTWPAKSEGINKNKPLKDSEPRAPSPGKMYEQLLGESEDGFVLQPPITTGFTLR